MSVVFFRNFNRLSSSFLIEKQHRSSSTFGKNFKKLVSIIETYCQQILMPIENNMNGKTKTYIENTKRLNSMQDKHMQNEQQQQ